MAPHETVGGNTPACNIRLLSHYDFGTTLSRFREAMTARGMTLFAEIDQADAAAGAGLALRPTTLFLFGSPKSGTPIMVAHPHAALELPLRAVVSENEQGKTCIDHQDIVALLKDRYGVAPALLDPMQGVQALMRAIAGQG